jgi:hypothetical protein
MPTQTPIRAARVAEILEAEMRLEGMARVQLWALLPMVILRLPLPRHDQPGAIGKVLLESVV